MFAYRHFENALALNDLKKAETIIINLINDNPKNIKRCTNGKKLKFFHSSRK